MEKKSLGLSQDPLGPGILTGLTGPMQSRHRSRSHVPETVTETETILRVIEISKHKINIINEEKNLWACLGTCWDSEF